MTASCTDRGADAKVGYEEQQIGKYSNLTTTEWQTYRADRKYIRSLVGPDTRIRLNLADDRQYRLAQARLKVGGKNVTNSPYLFEMLEATRAKHIRLGYSEGLRPDAIYRPAEDGAVEQHFISAASAGETSGEGASSSTYPGSSFYTFVDVSYFDIADVPLGEPSIVEQFGAGTDVEVSTSADLSQTDLDTFVVDTFKMEDSAGGFGTSYVYTDIGVQGAQPAGRPERPDLAVNNIVDPRDRRFNDNVISICLNRTWTDDCDYDLTGTPQAVKVPLQGSVRINSNHVFSQDAIDQLVADLTAGIPNPRAGYIKLLLTRDGGGCDLEADGALHASMRAFWGSVTLSADHKSLFWNMSGDDSAFFDDGCRQVQDIVKLTMRLQLPLYDPAYNLDLYSSFTLSSDPDQFAPDYEYDTIKMVNSCLAEGTMIQMVDSKEAPIESLSAGDRVFNSFHSQSRALTVTDTAVGFETVPMVRLVADSGHTLLATEMHPIQTPDRGIVLAKHLREGDEVITVDGASKLSQVTREPFDGKVYNLKLGTDAEKSAIGADQTLVYANGFLVGDGQIQSKYEAIEMAASSQGDVLERLPEAWHRDYERSPLRD